jgi:hypothetical protein
MFSMARLMSDAITPISRPSRNAIAHLRKMYRDMMALSSAPCPPGASLPSSLPLELTPNPTATTASAAVIPWTAAAAAPHPAASVPSPQLSPLAALLVSRGRPKEERWRDHSASPLSEFGSPPVKNLTVSFRDVLLVPSTPAASVAVGTVVTVVTEPLAPRNRTATPAWGAPLAAKEEWQQVESRRSWKQRLRAAARPRRLVQADLARVYFNCFSPSHFAAQCSQKIRCFNCHGLGHHSFWFSGKRGVSDAEPTKLSVAFQRKPLPRLFWKRKVLPAVMAAPPPQPPPPAATAAGDSEDLGRDVGVPLGNVQSHRRQRPCKRRASARGGGAAEAAPSPDVGRGQCRGVGHSSPA